MADVEKPRARSSTAIEVFSPKEVWALVRAAESEQNAAIFLTAAFTGLRRGELADVATTMKYLHYVERPDEAELVAAAFAVESPAPGPRRPHPTHTAGPP